MDMTKQVALITGAVINLNGGLKAVVSIAQQIALGEADVTIGAGAESMSRSGNLMPHARWGARMGHTNTVGNRCDRSQQGLHPPLGMGLIFPKGQRGLNAE
jgi:acetyl-CoA acetyltransferase